MGRKRKLCSDYVKEYSDFEESTSSEGVIVCKLCRVTVSIANGKGAVRIAEHLQSQRHVRMKTRRPDTSNSPQQSSLEECITRDRSKREDANDIPHQFCRALCHAGIPLHQADGPLGSLFRSKCPAARTMPGSDQLYRKYLHEVSDKDLATISSLMKDQPVSVTIDESPELRGRPAVAVLATFYDDELPGRRTLMIDLQIVQQCNAVSIAMLMQTALQKVGKTLGDIAVLCSDSASYMQKLHKDLQLSNPEFKALHFKDPCHLLNNALEEGIRTSPFNVVHDFVVHFPALLKSSRELRRKFGLVCLAMGMTIKSLKTVCPSRWFSFYEALEDILDYWRAILSFLRSDEAKGTKCEKLKSLISSPEAVHDLLVKMRFLKTNSCAVLSIIKELEAESTLVHQVYPILGVRLHALTTEWRDPTEVFASDVTSLLDLLDENDRLTTVAGFHGYYAAVAEKWRQTSERNLCDQLQYTKESFWYCVQIVNPNVKHELPCAFETYAPIFQLVLLETDDMSQLLSDFANYQCYEICNIVEPLSFWRLHNVEWPVLSLCALRLLALPVSSANVERAFSKLRVVNRKERASITDSNLAKYACVFYNKL